MKFASTGIRAASPSALPKRDKSQAGFTLLEALVALTIVLAFAATLGPLLFQARRITANADGRIAAQILLRALLQAPLDRADLMNLSRNGEGAGLQWRIAAEPTAIETTIRRNPPRRQDAAGRSRQQRSHWAAYRVVASVSWTPGQMVSAETVRLAQSE
jgi:prepilin-type N-terminal cleavage/methylation domain-containing protein